MTKKENDDDTTPAAAESSRRSPPPRHMRVSTRDNAAFKWKEDKTVVGALEILTGTDSDGSSGSGSGSLLMINPRRAKLEEHRIPTVGDEFDACLRIWKKDEKYLLRKSFAEAVEAIPPVYKCCGMISDPAESIIAMVPLLNSGWAKKISEEYFQPQGYRISCFAWTWSNIAGASQNVKLMIRFHTLQESKRHGFKG